MQQTSQGPFSQNEKFLSDNKTFSVWQWVWGNVLLNITVKYSVVPTTHHYYINGDWLQKDGGTEELHEWQLGSQTAVKDDATQPTTHSLKSARRQTKIEEEKKRADETDWNKKNNKRKLGAPSDWERSSKTSVTCVTVLWQSSSKREERKLDSVCRKQCSLTSVNHTSSWKFEVINTESNCCDWIYHNNLTGHS